MAQFDHNPSKIETHCRISEKMVGNGFDFNHLWIFSLYFLTARLSLWPNGPVWVWSELMEKADSRKEANYVH